jgi:hypothetical protein
MGFQHIAGVDEAGSGPLAGPVVAAACIIPSTITIEGICLNEIIGHVSVVRRWERDGGLLYAKNS